MFSTSVPSDSDAPIMVDSQRALPDVIVGRPSDQISLEAQNRELAAELAAIKAERARLLDRQRRMMDLLNTTAPEQLVHDLRNVLNERELFKALAFREGAEDNADG